MRYLLLLGILLTIVFEYGSAQDDTVNELIGKQNKIETVDEGCVQTLLSWEKRAGGLWIRMSGGMLCLQPCSWGGMHVLYGAESEIASHNSYVVTEKQLSVPFEVVENPRGVELRSSYFSAIVDSYSGHISFKDRNGKLLLQELPGKARKNVLNDSVNASCRFKLQAEDAIYGLGQFRDGRMNLRGTARELIQFNTQAAVPVIYSTGGWGLFWDNPSRTLFEDSTLGMSFVSDYGKLVDYYFFAGENLDALVAAYRNLTGAVPMLPYWALGFHQSRNRYHTDKEVIDVVHRMAEEKIPLSTIFIDYHYWGKYGTGSFRFDESSFPDVTQMLDSLHRTYDTKVVLTIWPCFKPHTPNYKEMSDKGYILEGAKAIDGYIYDPFNTEAAKMYWEKFSVLLKYDIDGWFLDGPEPDHVTSFLPLNTYAGPAQKVRNAYTLLHSASFYQGITKSRPHSRPYLLTRCAWAGQQKYGTAVWSGDIPATFQELSLQVTAGLNFTATGIPYWTTDIGGYLGGNPVDEAYRELFTRWFQYGTFCPIFRSHGRRYPGNTETPNELWAYGPQVQKICTDFIQLRYKLLPYIYTLTEKVSQEHYTPMRLLAFDFPTDKNVLDCKDQFMYGPSIMVCPVLQAHASSRSVYLPKGCQWIDFWNDTVHQGGAVLHVDAPMEQIPLFVRAGSVIPCYTAVKKNLKLDSPLEILVYGGADGSFELYEDDGETMEYKAGSCRQICFQWNDKNQALCIGAPNGHLKSQPRDILIRLKGLNGKKDLVKSVKYKGKAMQVTLK